MTKMKRVDKAWGTLLVLLTLMVAASGCESTGGKTKPNPAVIVLWENAVDTIAIQDGGAATGARDFGALAVGDTSASLTVIIENRGGRNFMLDSVELIGTDAADFALDATSIVPGTFAPGAQQSFSVSFAPQSAGVKAAEIRVTHSVGGAGSTTTFSIIGEGNPTVLTVYEGDVATGTQIMSDDAASGLRDFGSQVVSSGASSPQIFTLVNDSQTDITLTAPVLGGTGNGDFTLDVSSFSTTLAVNAETTFSVAFDPATTGTKLANVSFTHDNATTTSPFIVNVTGVGVGTIDVREGSATGPQIISGLPAMDGRVFASQDVNAGASAPLTIVLVNHGTVDIAIDPPTLAGMNPGEFVLDTTSLVSPLAANMETSFTISFDPSIVGAIEADVEVMHNAAGTVPSPFLIKLVGTGSSTLPGFELREGDASGTLIGDLTAGPLSIDMGSVPIGTMGTISYFIVNNGGVDLMLTAPMLVGSSPRFSLDASGFSMTVAAGAATSFDLTFSPQVLGADSTSISIGHNLNGVATPTSISVDALGDVAPTMTVQPPAPAAAVTSGDMGPDAVDVGSQRVSMPSMDVTLTVTNTAPAMNLTLEVPTLTGADAASFTLTAWTSQQVLAPSETRDIVLSFMSATAGELRATVSFNHDALGVGGPVFSFEIVGVATIPSAYAWGVGGSGQLGNGTTLDKDDPELVSATEALSDIQCGKDFTLAITFTGALVAWGNNSRGQLGDGSNTLRTRPVAVSTVFNVTQVAAGEDFVIALTSGGEVWSWGANDVGQLGDASGMDRNLPDRINSLSNISAIAVGESHALALDSSGQVWVWGSNSHGQLGLGNTNDQATPIMLPRVSNATAISAGLKHSHYIVANGEAFGFGWNEDGQLGTGTAGGIETSAVQIQSVPLGYNSIEGGARHTLAIDRGGKVFAWGANDKGQLGKGDTRPSNSPVAVMTARGQLDDVVVISAYADNCAAFRITIMEQEIYTWGDARAHAGTQVNRAERRSGVPPVIQRAAAGDGFTLTAE